MNKEQRMSAARDKYFSQNPHVLDRLEVANAKELEAIGSSEEEHRHQQMDLAFAMAAKSAGLEPYELAIRLVAGTSAQAQEWRLEHHRETAEALGISWDEYKSINRLGV